MSRLAEQVPASASAVESNSAVTCWIFRGNLSASDESAMLEQVACIRRAAKLLPIVLNQLEHDVMWAILFRKLQAEENDLNVGVFDGTFVLSDLLDSDLKPLKIRKEEYAKALAGIWPNGAVSISYIGEKKRSLEEALRIENDEDLEKVSLMEIR